MIIERIVYGSKESFFKVLVEAIINDVKSCTDLDILEKDIKDGFSYSKVITNKRNHLGKAIVKKYDKPNIYCIEIHSDAGMTTLEYQVLELDNNESKVIYKEEFINAKGKISNGYFYKRALQKRMNLFFNQIQQYMNKCNIQA